MSSTLVISVVVIAALILSLIAFLIIAGSGAAVTKPLCAKLCTCECT
jgi:hypothetical protein